MPRARRQRRRRSAAGYLLSRWVSHQSPGYLAEAFALSGEHRHARRHSVIAAAAACSPPAWPRLIPLLDLRRSAADAIYHSEGQRPATCSQDAGAAGCQPLALALLAPRASSTRWRPSMRARRERGARPGDRARRTRRVRRGARGRALGRAARRDSPTLAIALGGRARHDAALARAGRHRSGRAVRQRRARRRAQRPAQRHPRIRAQPTPRMRRSGSQNPGDNQATGQLRSQTTAAAASHAVQASRACERLPGGS